MKYILLITFFFLSISAQASLCSNELAEKETQSIFGNEQFDLIYSDNIQVPRESFKGMKFIDLGVRSDELEATEAVVMSPDGEEFTFQIVGELEADSESHFGKIYDTYGELVGHINAGEVICID